MDSCGNFVDYDIIPEFFPRRKKLKKSPWRRFCELFVDETEDKQTSGQESFNLSFKGKPAWKAMTDDLTYKKSLNIFQNNQENKNLEDSLHSSHSVTQINIHQFPATFIPDLILEKIQKNELNNIPMSEEFSGIVLFADISGFTSLTEIYSTSGRGVDELTRTLNDYIGAVVAHIISANGDIIKFAGDALLCLWREDQDLGDVLESAIDCSLCIQRDKGEQNTPVGVKLRIKLAIAVGCLKMICYGVPDSFLLYSLVGPTIVSLQKTQKLCKAGDIILDANTWELLKDKGIHSNYVIETLSMGYVKILQKLGDVENFEIADRYKKIHDSAPESINQFLLPVIRNIDSLKQLEFMSEMRQVTIVFISLPHIDVSDVELIDSLFSASYTPIHETGGVLNKAVMFDKGCTFLAVFGLPGFKQKNDSASALQCAARVTKALMDLSVSSSIAVTTGNTLCGIVGHPHRQEYTVIGRKVNLAARLMVYYSHVNIICDKDTYFKSRKDIGESSFQELEEKELKGISNVGSVYMYKWDSRQRKEAKTVKSFVYPILGLKEERQFIKNIIINRLENDEQENSIIVVVGDEGSGKSRLLDWSIQVAKRIGMRVCSCKATQNMKQEPYSTIAFLLTHLLDFDKVTNVDDKQKDIENILYDVTTNYPLALLNGLFHFKFPVDEDMRHMNEELRNSLTKILLVLLIKKCLSQKPSLIVVDDAHLMDDSSRDVILEKASVQNSLILLAQLPSPDDASSQKCHILQLQPLDSSFTAGICCQLLNVIGIHQELEKLLIKHRKGNPSWLEELLLFLKEDSVIQLVRTENIPQDRLCSEFIYLKRKFLKVSSSGELGQEMQLSSELSMKKVCDITPGKSLTSVNIPLSTQDMVLQRMNNLNPTQMLVLKKSSVFGMHIERQILEDICSDVSKKEVASILQLFIDHHILQCGINKVNVKGDCFTFVGELTKCTCEQFPEDPQIGWCRNLMFYSAVVQDTIYHSLTKDLRAKLHLEIVEKLGTIGMNCFMCRRRNVLAEMRDSQKLSAKSDIVQNQQEWEDEEEDDEESTSTDLRECTCHVVKVTVLKEMAWHWKMIGRKHMSLMYLLQSGEGSLENNEYVQTTLVVKEAIDFIKEIEEEESLAVPAMKQPSNDLMRAKVECYRLLAQAKLYLGNMDEGMCDLQEGIRLLGTNLSEVSKHTDAQYYATEALERTSPEFVYLESRCLGVASLYSMQNGDYQSAINFANLKLYMMIRTSSPFKQVLEAFTLIFQCYTYEPRRRRKTVEAAAVKLCSWRFNNKDCVPANDVQAISHTLQAVMFLRFTQNELNGATDIGFQVHKVLQKIHDLNMIIKVLSILSQAVMFGSNPVRSIESLVQLKECSVETENNTGLALYYGGLAEVIVEETFKVSGEYLYECRSFAQEPYKQTHFTHHPDVEFYLTSCLALWCVSFGMDLKSDIRFKWYKKAKEKREDVPLRLRRSFWTISASFNMLEGLNELTYDIRESFPVLEMKVNRVTNELTNVWNFIKSLH
ncbi:adenylate cyclase type 10-like isoform X2 [Tachypleus tridentatus]|uniref:adenylate cyclase type 10-like isoform X2 n=1 Tax=Tachypleus tridentatus TaxID=6853 RepID=UPI003FD4F254